MMLAGLATTTVSLASFWKRDPYEVLLLREGAVRNTLRQLRTCVRGFLGIGCALSLFLLVSGKATLVSLGGAFAYESLHNALVGTYEETLFRGLLLTALLANAKEPSVRSMRIALVVQAAVFAVAHIPSILIGGGNLVVVAFRMVELMAFGITLGLTTLKYQSIWGGVVYHAFSNLMVAVAGAGSVASIAGASDSKPMLLVLTVVQVALYVKPIIRMWKELE